MTDYFALLDQPRRPWLDVERLKSRFFALSAEVHPDRFHNLGTAEQQVAQQRFAKLNAAYNILREPKERLLHLLELEMKAKGKEIQQVPAGLMELFMELGQLCRDADAFLAERANAISPLLKVRMFEQSQEWIEKLLGVSRRIQGDRQRLLTETMEMNP